MTLGFTETKVDSNLFIKVEGRIPVMLLLCVDALLLGMEVWQSTDGIFIGQEKYIVEILKRFKMMDYKSMTTPMASNMKLLSDASSDSVDARMNRQMICSLMYLTNTRPDIFFAVKTLSQFLTDCCKEYFEVPKGYS